MENNNRQQFDPSLLPADTSCAVASFAGIPLGEPSGNRLAAWDRPPGTIAAVREQLVAHNLPARRNIAGSNMDAWYNQH